MMLLRLLRLTGRGTANALFLCAIVSLALACSAENKKADQGYIVIDAGTAGTATDSNPTAQTTGNGGDVAFTGGSTGVGGKTGGAAASSSTGDICADIAVSTSRATPWVLFVIDGSSSMTGSYGGSSNRWDAVYQTLMAPNDGVIAPLEGAAHFGILIYNGADPCPASFPKVAPALNNYKAIDAVYATARTSQGTPTADALKAAYQMVPNQQQVLDNPGLKNAFVVLCTDGQPNSCPTDTFGGFGEPDFDRPKAEVTNAAANGIKTYVISVADANEGADYQSFLDEIARIGSLDGKTPAFSPATKADLATKIKDIVGAALSCDLEVKGKVSTTDACQGTVMLNSQKLECNGQDGWELVDETHIRLKGKACTNFKGNAKIIFKATFPCGVVVVR